MDGLLINSEQIAHEVFLTLCKQHGGQFNKEIHSAILGTESEFWSNYVVDQCKLDITSKVFLYDFYQVYREILDKRIALMPGVTSFLHWISNKGYEKCLVTSSGKDNVEKNLKKVHLDEYFSYRITSDVTSRGKPDPEPYHLGAALINRDPQNCFVLEDSPSGTLSGFAAGCTVIAVPTEFVQPARFDKARFILSHIGEVIPILENMGL